MGKKQIKYETINTFSRFPSPAQICSYVVIILQTVIFYLMIRPNFTSNIVSITLTIAFSVTLAILILSTFICSFVDPSDSVMIKYKKQNAKKSPSNIDQLLYCDYCQSYVTQQARHCKQCDRCVERFDHHCMWINNCVGSKNYSIFIIMIVSTCINLSIYLISVVILSIQKNWSNFIGFMITSWCIMVVVGVLWFLLFNLNLLHFYLMCKGYTTYQFIMARRQQQRQNQFKKQEAQSKERQQRLKKVVQQTKKKIYQSSKVNQLPNTNSNINISKTISDKKGSQQQPNSKLNIKNQLNDLQATGVLKNQKKIDNIFISSSNRQQIQNQQNQVQSVNVVSEEKVRRQKTNNNLNENEILSSSDDNQSIKISKFFTKNKSFNLLISNKVAEKPHKKQNNLSLMVDHQPSKQIKEAKARSSVKYNNKTIVPGQATKHKSKSRK